MGRTAFFRGGRAGGENAPTGINLQRIGIDDDASQLCGNLERKGGFATCRCPGNQDRTGLAQC